MERIDFRPLLWALLILGVVIGAGIVGLAWWLSRE